MASISLFDWTISTTKSPMTTEHEDKTMPEMVFANSGCTLMHASGLCISFKALDALACVQSTASLQVAAAKAWQHAQYTFM
jgi:hypothetical protein